MVFKPCGAFVDIARHVCVCVCSYICYTVRTRLYTSLARRGHVCKVRTFCLGISKGGLRDKTWP